MRSLIVYKIIECVLSPSYNMALFFFRCHLCRILQECDGVVFPGPGPPGFLKGLKVLVSRDFFRDIPLSVCSTVELKNVVDSVLDEFIIVYHFNCEPLRYIFSLDRSKG
jgi:hypothetical protein